MSLLQHALVTLRRRRVRDERGFALMAVLAVVALTSVTIAALLGMLLTTIRATTEQERAARELRAADSAVEAAIAQLRRSSTGDGGNPCAVAAPLAPLDQISFDQGNASAGDDVDVEVECTPGTLGDPTATADQVRLVGAGGYQGDIPWSTDCAASAGPGCLPWSAATGGGAPGITPSLVHSGPEALRFDSGVTAKRGAAVLRNPVSGTPAVQASGQYLQGDAGPAGSGACGMLAPGGGSTEAGVIDDLDDLPGCLSSEAAAVDPNPTDPAVGFAVTDAEPSVPGCSGSVVQIQPGRYDATRTAQLNSLIAGCAGRTFHFLPGVISFDAESPAAGANRNALVLQGAGSYFVFGAPQGWSGGGVQGSAVADDPASPLCSPSQTGTSIVLSGRTEIRHLDGRVAICPAHTSIPDEPYPAIYQQTSVPGTTVSPTASLPRTYTFYCSFDSPCFGGNVASRSYELNVSTTGTRDLSSVKVLIAGTEGNTTQNNLITSRKTTLRVVSGPTEVCNTGKLDGIPNGTLTSSFELLSGGCAGALDNEADLAGTRIRVQHEMVFSFPWVVQPLTISSVDVQVNPAPGTVDGVVASNGWQNAGNVGAADGAFAQPDMCQYLVCEVAGPRSSSDPYVHEMLLDGTELNLPAALAASGVDANLTDLRLMVDVEPTTAGFPPGFELLNATNFRPEMDIRVEVRTPGGNRCTTSPGFVNSAQVLSFDLLGSDGADPGCTAVLSNYSDLEDSQVLLRLELPCATDNNNVCVTNGPNVFQVRPPNIDHVWLAGATDSYVGPPPSSQVNIDAVAGGPGSSFNTLGNVLMPLSDLDVHWNGAVTVGRPIIGGDLVLNGLGSDMQPTASMGVLCCSNARPGSRTVELIARVDGEDLLQVTVLFTDIDPANPTVYEPGFRVDVLDWATCDAGGCSSSVGP